MNPPKNDVKIWYIKHYDFFGSLDEHAMQYVMENTSMQTYQTRDTIYLSGDQKNIYLIKSGQVKISRIRQDGDEIIEDLLRPGEMFGALPMIDDFNGDDTKLAQAASDAVVCTIHQKQFEKLLQMHPGGNDNHK